MKLVDYIQGLRKGKEAHQLEKESMKDPFLADAMDGYRQTEGDHEQQLETLRRWVISRSIKKQPLSFVWSVAASLFIGVCLGGYFLLRSDKLTEDHYLVQEAIQAEVPAVAPQPVPDKVENLELTQTKEIDLADSPPPPVPLEIVKIVQGSDSDMKSVENPADIQRIRGTVTNQIGEPIMGANIAIKGTNKGTISDIDGNFALDTNGGEELEVCFIGYESITLPVDTGENLLITMNENKTTQHEVVVVGSVPQKHKVTFRKVIPVQTLHQVIKPKPLIGQELYEKYLKEYLIRPSDDACGQAEGTVVVLFHIDNKGRPADITVKKSLCESADREAIRLVQEGPDWTRGNQAVEVSVNF